MAANAYTFLNQQEFLSSLLQDSNTGTTDMWPLAQRKLELNQSEIQFGRDTKITMEYATSTISSMEISLPSGWLETFALYITIGSHDRLITRRREISIKDLERWSTYDGDIPYYYVWEYSGTKKIKFVGASGNNGRTYKLYYFSYPTTALSADGDTSPFPIEYRQASVYKAASNLLLQIGQYSRANTLLGHYDRLVQQAIMEKERWYKDGELPTPDLNVIESDAVDTQGQGWSW